MPLFMDKSLYIDILQFLYDEGINNKSIITSIVEKHYPLNKDYGAFERNPEIELYLRKMYDNGFIWYDTVYIHDLPNKQVKPVDCPLVVVATITLDGYKFITDLRRDNSTLETNKTIRKQSRNQTITLIIAAFLSLGSLMVSWFNYLATNDKSAQKQYLLPSKELISIFKKDTTSKKDEISHLKEVKKKSMKNL